MFPLHTPLNAGRKEDNVHVIVTNSDEAHVYLIGIFKTREAAVARVLEVIQNDDERRWSEIYRDRWEDSDRTIGEDIEFIEIIEGVVQD